MKCGNMYRQMTGDGVFTNREGNKQIEIYVLVKGRKHKVLMEEGMETKKKAGTSMDWGNDVVQGSKKKESYRGRIYKERDM